jgi:hypothetical protein
MLTAAVNTLLTLIDLHLAVTVTGTATPQQVLK